jgi:hypothetical protein
MEGRGRLGRLSIGIGSPSAQGDWEANPPVITRGMMGRGVFGRSESTDAMPPRKAPKR